MENVEDVYALTPLQEGMLYHSVAEPGTGVHVDQISMQIDGRFSPERFREAWRRALGRHAPLRTAFLWEGLDEPLQVVREQVELPWGESDWRTLDLAQRKTAQEERLEGERSRDFDLGEAPLVRMTLCRVGEQSWWWLWTFHHLILDGWSTSILLREVFRDAAVRTPSEPQGGRAYRDFIAWHAEQDQESAARYWREELRGFSEPTRVRSSLTSSSSSLGVRQIETTVSETTSRALQQLGRNRALTLNTILQGSWALLLSRTTGQEDVVFGATTSGRPTDLRGVEGSVGLFANTLPLRVRVNEGASCVSWLSKLQQGQVRARAFEFASLARIQKECEIEPGLPLFETILVFENYPEGESLVPEGADFGVGEIRYDEQSNYPLAMLCVPGERLRLIAVYAGDQYGSETVGRLLDRWVHLLEQISERPDAELGTFESMREGERRRLLEWSETKSSPSRGGFVPDWFSEIAEKTPARVAVRVDGTGVTYAELDESVTRTAKRLAALGVGRGDCVAVHAEPSREMIEGLLAVHRAGAAYVPLDTRSPSAHFAHVVNETQANVVVTDGSGFPTGFDTTDRVVLDLSQREDGGMPPSATEWERSQVHSGDLAYVMYTSGSSGRPKGVAVTHANLAHSTAVRSLVYPKPPKSFLLLSSFAFDSSVAGIFWTLTTGGTLVLAPRRVEQDLDALSGLMRREEVTHTLCLPSLYSLLLETADSKSLPELQTVIVAGEASSFGLVRQHEEQMPGVMLFNEYGPTEATVWSTVQHLDRVEPLGRASVPIGKPIPGMRAYVLDAKSRPVPVGVAGELWIAGEGVARGYVSGPAERFVEIEVFDRKERAYRTGDRVAWREDGALDFLGRVNSQVKVRGHRIEPAGIESILMEHPEIAAAAVAVRGTPPRLVAFLEKRGATHETKSIRDHLASRLPSYQVPDAMVCLPTLPRTSTGKIAYRNLPEVDAVDLVGSKAEPRDDRERLLASIWEDVLGVSGIGIHQDYFALGGDSILSIRIVSRIRQHGFRVDPRHVLELPTIAQLAATLERGGSQELPASDDTGVTPLAPIQAWFLSRDLKAPHHWNSSAVFESRDSIDSSALAEALRALAETHGQLRASFSRGNDGWLQRIAAAEEFEFPLDEVDLSKAPPFERESRFQEAMQSAQASLDLSSKLVRGVVFRGWGPKDRFLFVAHHLIVDAVSWGILAEDLETGYRRARRGEPIELPDRTATYGTWTQALANDETSAAPTDAPRGDAAAGATGPWTGASGPLPTEAEASSVRTVFSRELSQDLLARANDAYRTHSEELLLAGLVLVARDSNGGATLRIMREGHGRSGKVDVSRTVGWFTAMTPLAVTVRDADDLSHVLEEVKRAVRSLRENSQAYGAARAGSPASYAAREPSFLFNYLGRTPLRDVEASLQRVEGLEEATSRAAENARSHRVEMNVTVLGDQLQVDWIVCDPAHEPRVVNEWATQFEHALQRIVGHCLTGGEGRVSATDFPDADLDDDDLAKLAKRLGPS